MQKVFALYSFKFPRQKIHGYCHITAKDSIIHKPHHVATYQKPQLGIRWRWTNAYTWLSTPSPIQKRVTNATEVIFNVDWRAANVQHSLFTMLPVLRLACFVSTEISGVIDTDRCLDVWQDSVVLHSPSLLFQIMNTTIFYALTNHPKCCNLAATI